MQKATAKARELDLNTGIMSLMRLGQIYDFEGQPTPAVAAYQNAVGMAPDSEVARESRGHIGKPYRRPDSGNTQRTADTPGETRNN
jgi:hypothetical protein